MLRGPSWCHTQNADCSHDPSWYRAWHHITGFVHSKEPGICQSHTHLFERKYLHLFLLVNNLGELFRKRWRKGSAARRSTMKSNISPPISGLPHVLHIHSDWILYPIIAQLPRSNSKEQNPDSFSRESNIMDMQRDKRAELNHCAERLCAHRKQEMRVFWRDWDSAVNKSPSLPREERNPPCKDGQSALFWMKHAWTCRTLRGTGGVLEAWMRKKIFAFGWRWILQIRRLKGQKETINLWLPSVLGTISTLHLWRCFLRIHQRHVS